jgi:four helix bundle protein
MKHEIETRLVNLALSIDNLCKSLKRSYLSQHLATQIIRSSTSAALNYGEAQAAESKKDFVHKLSLVSKELRESKVSLRLLYNSISDKDQNKYKNCLVECDRLIGLFYKTIQTTKKNHKL